MSASIQEPPTKVVSSIPNYRNQVKKAIPAEYLKPDYSNLLWLPVHAAIIGSCYFVLTAHFAYWSAPLLALVVGHSFACLGFLAHDILHGGSIKTPIVRDTLAGISFSPFWIGPYLWRRWHNADHHNNTNIEGVDPDHLFTIDEYKSNAILRFLYSVHPLLRNIIIFSSFAYRMTQQNLRMAVTYLKSPKSTGRDKFTIVWQIAVPIAAWGGFSYFLGSQVLIWGYLVPLLVANSIAISYIATNHFLNPLADENDVLGTSLSVTLPKWLKFLDPWHQYFGAHVAHHLFPQAPGRYARAIEEKVKELWPDRYHQLPLFTALKALWNTPWIYEDKETLIDPKREIRSKTLGRGLNLKKKRKR